MTSENPFRSLDLSAGSFSIATIIQFYDFLKLDRRMGAGRGEGGWGGVAAHVIRRAADVYWGSMQKSIGTFKTNNKGLRGVRERKQGLVAGLESVVNSCYDDKVVKNCEFQRTCQ